MGKRLRVQGQASPELGRPSFTLGERPRRKGEPFLVKGQRPRSTGERPPRWGEPLPRIGNGFLSLKTVETAPAAELRVRLCIRSRLRSLCSRCRV